MLVVAPVQALVLVAQVARVVVVTDAPDVDHVLMDVGAVVDAVTAEVVEAVEIIAPDVLIVLDVKDVVEHVREPVAPHVLAVALKRALHLRDILDLRGQSFLVLRDILDLRG